MNVSARKSLENTFQISLAAVRLKARLLQCVEKLNDLLCVYRNETNVNIVRENKRETSTIASIMTLKDQLLYIIVFSFLLFTNIYGVIEN